MTYLKELFNDGKLLMTGPFLDDRRGGLFIVEVEDETELKKLIDKDPAIVNCIAISEARPYKILLKK